MRPTTTKGRLLAAGIALGVSVTIAAAGFALAARADQAPPRLVKALERHFPKTPIDSVRCDLGVPGLCEVVTGRNVFYAARDGRHVMVGALLDLEDKVDLTDKRIRELAALGNATAKIGGAAAPQGPSPEAAPSQPGSPEKLKVSLGPDSAIVHNPGATLKLTVFSDLNCGYCRKLFEELRSAKDIEVTEYPIAILGADSADKAKMALCADDRAKAASAFYVGGDVEVPAGCREGEARLAKNMAFAQANGIAGTPALVRADGSVSRGWMPLGEVRAWLAEGRS